MAMARSTERKQFTIQRPSLNGRISNRQPGLPILIAISVSHLLNDTIGMGSSVFHPEASRLARMASGGRHGFAQSIFQVGGNAGSALGPLLAALVLAHS